MTCARRPRDRGRTCARTTLRIAGRHALLTCLSSSLHRVQPVTRGARVASFFWVRSLVRDTARRQMLFELDQNIQALRAQVEDNEVVVGLTGHHHNLVRAWSEV